MTNKKAFIKNILATASVLAITFTMSDAYAQPHSGISEANKDALILRRIALGDITTSDDVKEFMNYLATQGVTDLSKIKRIHVTDFIISLHANKLRNSTMNKKINSISCLCKFLKMKSILPATENPVILKEDRVKLS